MLHSITVPIQVPLIWYSPLLPQYKSYHRGHNPLVTQYQKYTYTTVHYCPSTNPNDKLSKYQSCWYDIVHYCPSCSPTDMIQSATVPVPVPLIWYNPLLPQYKSYWSDTIHLCPQYQNYRYPTVHFCPSTSSNDMIEPTTPRIPVIQHSLLLSQFQSWYDTVRYWWWIILSDLLLSSNMSTIQDGNKK